MEAHPGLRQHMRSERFVRLAFRKRIEINGRELYVVRGDLLSGLDDLYIDALVRGAAPQSPDAEAQALFEELEPELRRVILELLNPVEGGADASGFAKRSPTEE